MQKVWHGGGRVPQQPDRVPQAHTRLLLPAAVHVQDVWPSVRQLLAVLVPHALHTHARRLHVRDMLAQIQAHQGPHLPRPAHALKVAQLLRDLLRTQRDEVSQVAAAPLSTLQTGAHKRIQHDSVERLDPVE